MTDIEIAYSQSEDNHQLVREIVNQIKPMDVSTLICFTSSNINYLGTVISRELNKQFPDAEIFGCTTAGELISSKMLENSIVAMALSNQIVDQVAIEVINNTKAGVKKAFKKFEKKFNCDLNTASYNDYFGLILSDGLSGKEEVMMEEITNLTNIMFVGGSAGDDLEFNETSVFANGGIQFGKTLLALFKPKVSFDIIKTQSFDRTGKKLKVTAANEKDREVMSLNGRPAVKEYSKVTGVSEEQIEKAFSKYPVGLSTANGLFVRSPQQVKDKKIVFYCNVLEGMELELLEATDIVSTTKKVLKEPNLELNNLNGEIQGIIDFDCILRRLQLVEEEKQEEYVNLFDDIPFIGFNTYGEQFLGHINQTATMLVIGE